MVVYSPGCTISSGLQFLADLIDLFKSYLNARAADLLKLISGTIFLDLPLLASIAMELQMISIWIVPSLATRVAI